MDARVSRLIALAESCIGFAAQQVSGAGLNRLKGLLPAYARLQRLAGLLKELGNYADKEGDQHG